MVDETIENPDVESDEFPPDGKDDEDEYEEEEEEVLEEEQPTELDK